MNKGVSGCHVQADHLVYTGSTLAFRPGSLVTFCLSSWSEERTNLGSGPIVLLEAVRPA
jgi:hypothetical protein